MKQRIEAGELLAFLACFLSMTGVAAAGIEIPSKPLLSGNTVPANIMLILDDSNSMGFDYLIDPRVQMFNNAGLYVSTFSKLTYTTNRLAYNPSIDYKPWLGGDGNPLPNANYNAVSSDNFKVSGAFANLSMDSQTFYVPASATSDVRDPAQYHRYQILPGGRIVRSERALAGANVTTLIDMPVSAARNTWVGGTAADAAPAMLSPSVSASVTVPPGATKLIVAIAGSDLNANVYVRYGAPPTTAVFDCRKYSASTSTETCEINSPAGGTWYVGVRAGNADATSGFDDIALTVAYEIGHPDAGVADGGCDGTTTGWGWRKCEYATPTGRSEEAERQNYANWYAYHRTRAKAAKAGVTRAFSGLGPNYRIGLAGLYEITKKIPVEADGGLFRNQVSPASSNRRDWFDALLSKGASTGGATPLRGALNRVGLYFSDASNTGPYAGTGNRQLSCRQNFSILTTDGYWNADSAMSWGLIGDDNQPGETITGPNGESYTYQPEPPYASPDSQTLADVAMHYWRNDLRVDLQNDVPSTSRNPAFWQHMVTFGISLGLKGTLNAPNDLGCLRAGTCNWPTPVSAGAGEGTQPANIDDLWHASVNSRGQFSTVNDPDEFAEALGDALAAVVERTASSSNVVANQSSIGSDTRVFQARYVSNEWSGELASYPVQQDGIALDPEWRASEQIPSYDERKIITWNGSQGAVFPTATQESILESAGAGITDYVRGDRSREASQGNGGGFRDRPHALGDIVHSSPIYVADTDTVYVGANDGMMHAFRATDGRELFAYVPGHIDLNALAKIASPSYGHSYFVDGPLVSTTRDQTPGRNVLVGTLGRGGRGLFALDVSAPENFGVGQVLWDKGRGDDSYPLLGNSLGRPLIARLNTGDYGVIVANGPNSANDTAVLYVLDLETGAALSEIDTGVGGAATGPNGLSEPRGWDEDGDGDVDVVYAGDLLGNLWKFDIGTGDPDAWQDAANRSVVAVARDQDGRPQPISGAPGVAMHPLTFETWVFFGTGRLINDDDLELSDGAPNLAVQSWYGVRDVGTETATRAKLQSRRIVAATGLNGRPVRSFEEQSALVDGARGWYVDLVSPSQGAEGERIVSESTVVGDVLIAASVIPEGDDCDQGGRGYINAIDAFTGSTVKTGFFDIDDDGDFEDEVITVDGEPVLVGSIDLGVSMPTAPTIIDKILAAGGSDGSTGTVGVSNPGNQGRISWQELIEQ
jgi:type IV pilus assembly protein PilY1